MPPTSPFPSTTTPTTFLTSLITSLSSLSPTSTSPQTTFSNTQNTSSATQNASTRHTAPQTPLPESARPLLLTLHVLFPHVVLDALDLLDRGLVVRERVCLGNEDAGVVVTATNATSDASSASNSHGINADTSHQRPPNHKQPTATHRTPLPTTISPTYYVRSAQPTNTTTTSTSNSTTPTPSNRRPYNQPYTSSRAKGNLYQVHLTAWNCSCPGFAFAAFGGGSSGSSGRGGFGEQGRDEDVADMGDEIQGAAASRDAAQNARTAEHRDIASRWRRRILTCGSSTDIDTNPTPTAAEANTRKPTPFRFGGLSLLSGRETGETGMPPVCKHLLACVLAEECGGLFGGIMNEGAEEGEGEETRRERSGRDGSEGRRGVVERWVGEEERAGWAGGWGFA